MKKFSSCCQQKKSGKVAKHVLTLAPWYNKKQIELIILIVVQDVMASIEQVCFYEHNSSMFVKDIVFILGKALPAKSNACR